MRPKSESLSVLLGIGILALVTLSSGGIAYSFYRTEISEAKEESSEVANDDSSSDSPFEQLEREKNIVTTPVPIEQSGSGSMDSKNSGIPIGTYSNPPSTVIPTSDSYIREETSSINGFDSFIAERDNLYEDNTIDSSPDYSRPTSSNNFNSTNNSLVKQLEDSSFLETPTRNNRLSNTSPLERSPF